MWFNPFICLGLLRLLLLRFPKGYFRRLWIPIIRILNCPWLRYNFGMETAPVDFAKLAHSLITWDQWWATNLCWMIACELGSFYCDSTTKSLRLLVVNGYRRNWTPHWSSSYQYCLSISPSYINFLTDRLNAFWLRLVCSDRWNEFWRGHNHFWRSYYSHSLV